MLEEIHEDKKKGMSHLLDDIRGAGKATRITPVRKQSRTTYMETRGRKDESIGMGLYNYEMLGWSKDRWGSTLASLRPSVLGHEK